MMRAVAVMICALVGAEAHALSCAPSNVAGEFNWYQNQPETYRIFVGKVKMSGPVPKYREGKPLSAKGVAQGRFVGKRSLTDVRSVDLTVNTACAASWCGGFPTQAQDLDWIMFLKSTPSGDVLTIGPCHQPYGEHTQKRQINILQKCLRQGKCSDSDIERLQVQ